MQEDGTGWDLSSPGHVLCISTLWSFPSQKWTVQKGMGLFIGVKGKPCACCKAGSHRVLPMWNANGWKEWSWRSFPTSVFYHSTNPGNKDNAGFAEGIVRKMDIHPVKPKPIGHGLGAACLAAAKFLMLGHLCLAMKQITRFHFPATSFPSAFRIPGYPGEHQAEQYAPAHRGKAVRAPWPLPMAIA